MLMMFKTMLFGESSNAAVLLYLSLHCVGTSDVVASHVMKPGDFPQKFRKLLCLP